jgi:CRP/FNR family transcriptional regulator, cyclic AMP receptor protein
MSGGPAHALPALRVADHPFFHGLDERFVQLASSGATERSFEVGEILFQEGDIAGEFWLVFHGKVALEIAAPDRPHLTIQTVGSGDVLGWSWLVPPHRWRFDARAVKATRTLAIDAKVLKDAFEAHPEDGYRFLLRLLPVIGDRLENAWIQVLDIHGV